MSRIKKIIEFKKLGLGGSGSGGNDMTDINTITLDSGSAGATSIKIDKDANGNSFSLEKVEGSARLIIDSSAMQNANFTLRIRTDNGNRYLALKSGIAKNNCLELGFEATVVNGVTSCITIYQASASAGSHSGSSASPNVTHLNTSVGTPIKDVEIFLLDGSDNIPLLEGSFLCVKGIKV